MEKIKQFERCMIKEIVKYTLESMKRNEDFEEGVAEMEAALTRCLMYVIVAGAIASGMDREKFSIHVDKLAISLKRNAHGDFDMLEKKGAPGPEYF